MAPKTQEKKKEYDYSALAVGMHVQAEFEGVYYAAEVLEVSMSKRRAMALVKISYIGHRGCDEWVHAGRLRSKVLNPTLYGNRNGSEALVGAKPSQQSKQSRSQKPEHSLDDPSKVVYKLQYFSFIGLGECIRATFALAGILFEDDIVCDERWEELKPTLPVGSQLPILRIARGGDTQLMFQSRAILRYVGSIGSYEGTMLYPTDPMTRFHCDEVIELIEDFRAMPSVTGNIENQIEKAATRTALLKPGGEMYAGLQKLNERLGKFPFAAGDKPSIADAYVVTVCYGWQHGFLADKLEDFPNIIALRNRLCSLPPLKEYYKNADGIRAPFECSEGVRRERERTSVLEGKGQGKVKRGAAGIILLLGQDACPDKIVISCQRRRDNPQSWELPKGGIELADGNDYKLCAIRELKEETGVTNDFSLKEIYDYGSKSTYWHLARAQDESDLTWGPIVDKDTVDARCCTIIEALSILRSDHKELVSTIVRDIQAKKLTW